MSNTNWSKGPWTFDKYRNAKDGNGNTLMAEGVSIPCGHSKEEVEANMNLFIASRDLYSVLESIVSTYERGFKMTEKDYMDAIDSLSKARGEQ